MPSLKCDREVLEYLSATLNKEFLTKLCSELKTFPDYLKFIFDVHNYHSFFEGVSEACLNGCVNLVLHV